MKKVTTLETVNPQIIEQSILIKQFDKVSGMVSFEAFDQLGLFVILFMTKTLFPDLLVNMFLNCIDQLKEKRLIN